MGSLISIGLFQLSSMNLNDIPIQDVAASDKSRAENSHGIVEKYSSMTEICFRCTLVPSGKDPRRGRLGPRDLQSDPGRREVYLRGDDPSGLWIGHR